MLELCNIPGTGALCMGLGSLIGKWKVQAAGSRGQVRHEWTVQKTCEASFSATKGPDKTCSSTTQASHLQKPR